MEDEKLERWQVLLFACLFEGGLGALGLALGWLVGASPAAAVHFDLSGLLIGGAAALPLALLFIAFVRWPIGPLARIARILDEHLLPFLEPCSTWDLATISMMAGVGEELLFRGAIQGPLTPLVGTAGALILGSALFGLAHCITLTYAVIATVIGGYLGGLWIVTDNLLVPIVAHALYDFIGLVYLLRLKARSGRPATDESD